MEKKKGKVQKVIFSFILGLNHPSSMIIQVIIPYLREKGQILSHSSFFIGSSFIATIWPLEASSPVSAVKDELLLLSSSKTSPGFK